MIRRIFRPGKAIPAAGERKSMTTLDTPPLAPLIERLFAEEAALLPRTRALFAEIPPDERDRLMRSRTEYRAVYHRLREAPIAVSRETGRLLYLLARAGRAREVVEFGTSFGLSTLHLAAALRDNGGGRVIATEFEPAKAARARAHFVEGGVADLVELREGDALDTLSQDLPPRVDLLLLDGAKGLYPDILARIEPALPPGALVVADNADWSPDYLARVRSGGGYLSLPFGEEVELSVRLG